MSAVFKREIRSYFTSAIGYIFLATFLFFSGLFFYLVNLAGATPDMSSVFGSMIIVCVILIPTLTMRLFSDEKKQKTDQALLTAPVSLVGIVMGKFLAAFLMFSGATCFMIVYAFILSFFGTVEAGVVAGSILGFVLLGAALIAIGMFISNLTESQMVAAIASVGVILFLLIADSLTSNITNPVLSALAGLLTISTRYSNFSTGYINISDIFYFLSVAAVFIFLTTRIMEKRRWS